MCHYPSARRPAHAVEPARKEVQDSHDSYCSSLVLSTYQLDRNDHEEHCYGGKYQAEGKEYPCVGTVGDAAHQEFGECIGRCVQAEDEAQFHFLESKGSEEGDCKGQVLADEVETGVSDECSGEYLKAESSVSPVCRGACFRRSVVWLS